MKLLQTLVAVFTWVAVSQALQCKDEQARDVDWYVLYKLPKLKSSANPLIQQGLGYIYITSDTVADGWNTSSLAINDRRSMPALTLAPVYANNASSLLYALYNDQPPVGEVVSNLGHTKGVVVARTEGGFWLVHSVPHFPPPPGGGYAYPTTGQHYGQSFLCISLNAQQMEVVGVQLTYNEPAIFSSSTPANLAALYPRLDAAARSQRVVSAPWFHQASITSRGGPTFLSFAKSANFHKDLYADWVAVTLQVDLLVESWLNGQGRLPSSCKRPFTVENVETVGLHTAGVNFTTHLDHSKWATAADRNKPWVCVGDINRESGQFSRGGGTVCISHAQLWTAYRTAVTAVEPCPAARG